MTLRLPSLHTGPRSGALRRTQAVYTHNVLHFAQSPVDDESVKISNLTRNRSSAPPSVLPASRPGIELSPKRQFLFSTNEPLSLTQNFVNPTKQSTSFFLFSTSKRSPISTHAHFDWLKTSLRARVHTRSTFSQTVYSLVGDDEVSGQNPAGRNHATRPKPLICHGFEIFR